MTINIQGPLSYMGVDSPTPPNLTIQKRAPLAKDYKSFVLGDLWLQKKTINIWMLTDKQAGVATWTDISTGGDDTFKSVTITTGDLTLNDGDIHITNGDVYIHNGGLVIEAINFPSTLRTLSDGTIYGLADVAIPAIDEGTVYHINDSGIAQWGDVRSSGTTVTITTTATGINLEAAGGTAANIYTTDDGFGVVPDGAGNVTIAGGVNIGTIGAVANTVTFNLDDEITLTTVHATVFDTNVATAGVTLTGTSLIADGTDADIDIHIVPKGTGTVFLGDNVDTGLTRGVVQSSAAGLLSSSEGSAGQVLVSSDTGAPAWANITSTAGTMDITNGNNTINIESYGDYILSINEQTGTIYTLILTDAGKEIQMANVAAITLTIPTKTAVPFIIGTEIILVQYGAGAVTVVPTAGVTLNSASGMTTLYEQYSAAALIKQDNVGEGTWLLAGDIK